MLLIHTHVTIHSPTLVTYRRLLNNLDYPFTVWLLTRLFRWVFLRQYKILMLFELLLELDCQPMEKFTFLIYSLQTVLFRTDNILESIDFVCEV